MAIGRQGNVLGVFADIASVDYRQSELRSLSHLPDDFEPPARFLDRVALHLAKNLLAGHGQLTGQVPLVLGIWGHKVWSCWGRAGSVRPGPG